MVLILAKNVIFKRLLGMNEKKVQKMKGKKVLVLKIAKKKIRMPQKGHYRYKKSFLYTPHSNWCTSVTLWCVKVALWCISVTIWCAQITFLVHTHYYLVHTSHYLVCASCYLVSISYYSIWCPAITIWCAPLTIGHLLVTI